MYFNGKICRIKLVLHGYSLYNNNSNIIINLLLLVILVILVILLIINNINIINISNIITFLHV